MTTARPRVSPFSVRPFPVRWLPILVLGVSLLLTGSIWSLTKARADSNSRVEFESTATRVAQMTRDRMLTQEAVLRGGAALLSTSSPVSREDWHRYVKQLELKERFPGLQSMDFALQQRPSELETHVEALRHQGFTEPALRTAMEKARDTGKETVAFQSGPETRSPLVMYAPVYEKGVVSANVAKRRSALRGYVFGVLDGNEIVRGILRDFPAQMRCEIGATGQTAQFTTTRSIEIEGYSTPLHCQSSASPVHSTRPLIVLAAGIPISLLLFAIAYAQMALREHARTLASDMTRKLREDAEESQRVETNLRRAQRLEAIDTLAAGVAQHFDKIIGDALGYGELARNNLTTEGPARRYLDMMMSAGMRAQALVERILTFSHGVPGERNPVHVQATVAEALSLVRASLPAVGVRLTYELHADDSAIVGDPRQIHQIVMNLCTNALEAMSGGGGALTVYLDVVSLEDSRVYSTGTLFLGDYIRLRVRDNGVGMAPETLERIFDPFFTTKPPGEGTGLGLSIVRGIATDMGGAVDVQSERDQGTTVTVLLPRYGHIHSMPSVTAQLRDEDAEALLASSANAPGWRPSVRRFGRH